MDLYTIRNKLNMGVPLTDMNLKVTIYARVSTEHLEQKKSLKNQIEHFYEYINSIDKWTYIEGYIDEGITGTSDTKRDNFMRMIEDAKKNKFDLIITKEISRFSRNTLDSIKYTRELLSYGVFVLFVNDNINTALSDSELRLTIMASMAQDEIRRLSERVKFGMKRAILRGELLGNNLIYGYKKDKITNSLKIINEEANIVKRIYKLYTIDRLSLSKIAKLLNNEKIPTKEGTKWYATTISRIITNPKYKGYYCGKKTEIIDYMNKKTKYLDKSNWITYKANEKIPQIIDEKLWDKANQRIEKNKKTRTINNTKYLYSGKIICSKDNTVFTRRIFRRNNKDITWVCRMYLKEGKKYCSSPNIRESELNIIMKNLVTHLNINLSNISSILIKEYQKNLIGEDNKKDLLKEQQLILDKKEKLLEHNLNNNITNEEFKIRNELLNDKMKKIKEELKKIEQKKEIDIITLNKYIHEKINSNEVIEKIIEIILNKIIVKKENEIIKLKIHLKIPNNNYTLRDKYIFERGFDTKCTRRYNVIYVIEYFYN